MDELMSFNEYQENLRCFALCLNVLEPRQLCRLLHTHQEFMRQAALRDMPNPLLTALGKTERMLISAITFGDTCRELSRQCLAIHEAWAHRN